MKCICSDDHKYNLNITKYENKIQKKAESKISAI